MRNILFARKEQLEYLWYKSWDISSQLWIKYSDLISSITITTLDVIYLAGEYFHSFPKGLSHFSFTLIHFTGVISFGFLFDELRKSMEDVKVSNNFSQYWMLTGAAIKVLYIASSILLISSGIIAAMLRLYGMNKWMSSIYSITAPIGALGVAITFFLDIYYLLLAKRAIKILEKGIPSDQIPNLVNFLIKKESSELSKELLQISIITRGCMDKDTWYKFLSKLRSENRVQAKKLIETIPLKNLRVQTFAFSSNLFLRIIGDIGMAIAALHPASLPQAVIWTFFSTFYSIRLIVQKAKQANNRKEIDSLCNGL